MRGNDWDGVRRMFWTCHDVQPDSSVKCNLARSEADREISRCKNHLLKGKVWYLYGFTLKLVLDLGCLLRFKTCLPLF